MRKLFRVSVPNIAISPSPVFFSISPFQDLTIYIIVGIMRLRKYNTASLGNVEVIPVKFSRSKNNIAASIFFALPIGTEVISGIVSPCVTALILLGLIFVISLSLERTVLYNTGFHFFVKGDFKSFGGGGGDGGSAGGGGGR
jgi:hypothetical protein